MTISCSASAIGTLKETELVAVRGDDNFFNFDMDTDLDVGDEVQFWVASREADLTDADALVMKDRSSGIADVDAPNGIFQVQLEPADIANLDDEAYVFKCRVRKVDAQMFTTLARGTMRMQGP